MPKEVFHVFDWNRKAQAFPKHFHISHARHFTLHVKKRPSAVTRIDLSRGLNIKLPLELTGFGADDSFRHRSFQAQRTADRKNTLSHRQNVRFSKRHRNEFGSVLVLDPQQREVLEFVHRDNAHLLVNFPLQLAIPLMIDINANLSLSFDHMEVGYQVTFLVKKETGTQ